MLKRIKNQDSVEHTWLGQVVQPGTFYTIQASEEVLWANDSQLLQDIANNIAVVNDGDTNFSDLNEAVNFLKNYSIPNPKTTDSRDIIAANRIPSGFTICPIGDSDNISTGAYGGGTVFKMDDSNTGAGSNKCTAQFLSHWYGIGGRIIWESATLADSVDGTLVAPASIGLTNSTGDYNKYNIGGPYNMILPVAIGTGAWSLDLTAKLTNTQILKCTPVPAVGNNGWFDYDSDANTLTRNMDQTGSYNLYDFDINLFQFARKVWGRKQDGAESVLESTDVVGKLLFNSWQIRFTLNNVTSGVKCGIIVTTAMKKNI